MSFPVRTMTRSSLLIGQDNGKLDAGILRSTPGQAGGSTVTLVEPAARAWRALCAAALKAGHTLKATSAADSYRLYEIQERIFRERYTTTFLANRPYKIWNGRRWYQRPGTAVAAVPGTSNHGWASAVDTGEERDSDAGAESLDNATLSWLLANEQTYGWSHEVQSEPWHLRYFAGDAIPAAVLTYEKSLAPKPVPPPAPPKDDLVSYYFVVPQSRWYCIRPWAPHVRQIDGAAVVDLTEGGVTFVKVDRIETWDTITRGVV